MYKKSTILFILLFTCLNSWSQLPKAPYPPKLYNDLNHIGFLTPSEEILMEKRLEKFEKETSNEIAVIIVDDLGDYDVSDYAIKISNLWKVGKEKEKNGVVILIKPTGGKRDKKIFIAVGRGLEGAIPDITCKRIIENELIPNFKNEAYYNLPQANSTANSFLSYKTGLGLYHVQTGTGKRNKAWTIKLEGYYRGIFRQQNMDNTINKEIGLQLRIIHYKTYDFFD